jgi:hypothetical protein
MGIFMNFYAGDAEKIAEAENNPEMEVDLRTAPFVRAHVDFSIRVTTYQIDPLIKAACARRGVPAMALTTSFIEHLAGAEDPTEADNSADIVAPEIVETLAALREEDVRPIGEQWFRELNATLTQDAEDAIRGLVHVCKTAQMEKVPVILTWSL